MSEDRPRDRPRRPRRERPQRAAAVTTGAVGRSRAEVDAAYARTVAGHHGDIQVSNATRLNRYPGIFRVAATAAMAAGLERPRILSFGSSTGEEAYTLTQYFPGASVLGLDISDPAIAQARAAYGATPGVQFEKSGAFAVEPGSLDLIFAMSVLCRWPVTKRMDAIADLYPFAAFEQHVAYLDSLLRPGGLMVIFNANYGFLQSRISLGYDLVVDPQVNRAGPVRRFRRDGTFDPTVAATDCIYRKRASDAATAERGLRLLDGSLQVIGIIERDVGVRDA